MTSYRTKAAILRSIARDGFSPAFMAALRTPTTKEQNNDEG